MSNPRTASMSCSLPRWPGVSARARTGSYGTRRPALCAASRSRRRATSAHGSTATVRSVSRTLGSPAMKSWSSPSLPSPVPGTRAILTAYDTASGAVVPIGPASGTARLYVCGITPYDATHMGHAFTYVTFDLLNRAWRDAGLDVAYTQNVTDVDDPLLERALATGVDWITLAEDQTDLFREDMTALRVIPPKTYAGAVESIPEVIALIQRLAHAGYVYQVDDEHADWYFTTNRAQD